MNILFVSEVGECLGTAMRTQAEGHPTTLHIEDDLSSRVGDGILPKSSGQKVMKMNGECIASSINSLLSTYSPDLVVFDSIGMGKVTDYVREKKVNVFGSSRWTDTLSSSSDYVSTILTRAGIDKWNGEKGVEVECGIWWNGITFLFPFIVWNETRFLTASLGPNIDSSSHITSLIPPSSALLTRGIGKIEKLLKRSKFRGILSLRCMVTETNIYGISFTSSSLFLPSLLELYKGEVTDLLSSVACGQKPTGEITGDYVLSLLLSIPPFPFSYPAVNTNEEVEVRGIVDSNLRHLYLIDIQKDGSRYVSGSRRGKLMRVNARGRDVVECKRRVMKTISNLAIDNLQYRVDPLIQQTESERQLVSWGYLESRKFKN